MGCWSSRWEDPLNLKTCCLIETHSGAGVQYGQFFEIISQKVDNVADTMTL